MWTKAGLEDLIENGLNSSTLAGALMGPGHVATEDLVNVAEVAADILVGSPRPAINNPRVISDLESIWFTADDPALIADADFGTVHGMWIYRVVTGDNDSILWCYLELTTPITTNTGDLALEFNEDGIALIVGSTLP